MTDPSPSPDPASGAESTHSDPTLIATLGQLGTSIDKAAEKAERAERRSDKAVAELRSERLWRRWTRRAIIGALIIVAILFFNDRRHQDALIARLSVSADACAHQAPNHQTLGCENHAVLVSIQQAVDTLNRVTGPQAQAASKATVAAIIAQVVSQTDCVVRKDLADALHAALPADVINLPATTACPAYKVGP